MPPPPCDDILAELGQAATSRAVRERDSQNCIGTRGPMEYAKSQQEFKKIQDYAFANPTAKFRTHYSLKGNT
ncbi:hypothetical protein GRJ2_002134100 [Grus japonensis]|uniref:Uncharacterized protein n=1 Tax=Grus japonensis TaxID=30415 RepID=A0ABC9XG68_GRUJA